MSAAGSSSLGGEGNYAKTFNNQDSENLKRFEKGGKENDIEDKDQTGIPDPERFGEAGKPC
ncbi:hypothetical protein D623_10021372 [Myotis brandtii]|uniref:Uncharacterized protein n=1 Tax=Myotis brandtii TaxID=109478 RepID=S7PVZ7_MYOBR|nr:hypothetical protein D623_10021372 [Myotis brandtii]